MFIKVFSLNSKIKSSSHDVILHFVQLSYLASLMIWTADNVFRNPVDLLGQRIHTFQVYYNCTRLIKRFQRILVYIFVGLHVGLCLILKKNIVQVINSFSRQHKQHIMYSIDPILPIFENHYFKTRMDAGY